MTGREKIEGALSPEGSPAFAAVTCYQGICLRDHWEQATDAYWWALHDPRPAYAAQPWLDFLERTQEDWMPLNLGYSRQAQEELYIHVPENIADAAASAETQQKRSSIPDVVWLVNRRTGERQEIRRPPIGGDQPAPGHKPPGADIQNEEELAALLDRIYGRPERSAKEQIDEGALELPRLLLEKLGQEKMPYAAIGAPFWLAHALFGLTGLLERIVETPALVHFACQRLLSYCLRTVGRLAQTGARLIWLEDCFTDMISPAHFREFHLAYLRPLVEAIQEAGMYVVHYFCGRPHDRWELLLDTGANALALEESKKDFVIDIMDVAERLQGRMALWGNIDAIGIMEKGTEAALRAEIERQCAAGRLNRNRFVVSVGSPVTPATPLSRVRRYCELVHEISPG